MSLPLRPISEINVQPASITWLWPAYLAAGKLSMLDGDPGCGKSLLTIDLAARLSRAGPSPDGFSAAGPRRTLMLNAEDDPADTILPRLRAAGADLDRIFVPNADDRFDMLQLSADLPRLEALIRELDIGLLVVDSLSAFLPPNLAHCPMMAVRQILFPLAQLASHTGAAVLLVRHLSKRNRSKALHRGLGSVGITGLARTVLLAGPHPTDPASRVVSVVKSNLAAPPAPMADRLGTRDGTGM